MNSLGGLTRPRSDSIHRHRVWLIATLVDDEEVAAVFKTSGFKTTSMFLMPLVSTSIRKIATMTRMRRATHFGDFSQDVFVRLTLLRCRGDDGDSFTLAKRAGLCPEKEYLRGSWEGSDF